MSQHWALHDCSPVGCYVVAEVVEIGLSCWMLYWCCMDGLNCTEVCKHCPLYSAFQRKGSNPAILSQSYHQTTRQQAPATVSPQISTKQSRYLYIKSDYDQINKYINGENFSWKAYIFKLVMKSSACRECKGVEWVHEVGHRTLQRKLDQVHMLTNIVPQNTIYLNVHNHTILNCNKIFL